MLMPKMGESIMEGTVLKWLKKEGDKINEDESVLEVATDKVDTEIPSTCSGTLKKILAEEGDVVKVGSPIAIIDSDEENTSDNGLDFIDEIEKNFEEVKEITYQKSDTTTKKIKSESNRFYSPLVLNIATRENISLDTLDEIHGTGENDRVTKYDLLKFIEEKNLVYEPKIETSENNDVEIELKEGEELIEPDRVRKIIASRMVESKKIAPHVTSFVEADITNIYKTRNEIKETFLKENKFPITFNPIFIKCVADENDELVAFAITMPSFSNALKKIKGKVDLIGKLRLLYAKNFNSKGSLYLIGVRPDFQNKGVIAILFNELQKFYNKFGITEVETNPELIENTAIQQLWKNYENNQHKNRATFTKQI